MTNITNDDITEEALSSLEPKDRAMVEAAVFLIAAQQTLRPFDLLYAQSLSVQADLLLTPLKQKKMDEEAAMKAKIQAEVDEIAKDIQSLL
jgi:hypothetical protein